MSTHTTYTPAIERVVISGGGTGGHIFPALSIAQELRRRYPQVDIRFVGAEGRMEMERVPKAGFPITGLPVMGLDRKRLWRNFTVIGLLFKSLSRAGGLLKQFKPQAVIGVGGYASGPTLITAQQLGIPTLIQEQNSYAGVTNKLVGKRAKAVCTAYTQAERFFPKDRVTLTGNPVRHDLLECTLTQAQAKQALGFDPAKPLVLVVGGSLGARTLNQAMAKGWPEFAREGIQLLWQTGKSYAAQIDKATQGAPAGIKAQPFIDDMGVAYRAADLVVSRAGAGTVSELQLLGKPVILVPSPNVAEDHQRKNALALVDNDAAVMILDSEAADRLTAEALSLIKQPQRLEALSTAIHSMALHNAAQHIVDKIETIIGIRN